MRTALFALLVAWAGASASAHEFWMLPDSFVSARPGPVTLGLFVGVNLEGQRVAFNRSVVARLLDVSRAGAADLSADVGSDPVGAFTFAAAAPGTHLVVMDSHPSRIELPADVFNAYLQDEGLDEVMAARQARGTQSSPGRERFRRNVKSIVQVGAGVDDTHSTLVGQSLEIVPLRNPALAHAGEELAFRVFHEGKPAAGVLVKSWHRQGDRTTVARSRTDESGTVKFAFGVAGGWMVSAVRMVAATGETPDVDWDSYWANLTFRIPR